LLKDVKEAKEVQKIEDRGQEASGNAGPLILGEF
jgi:hypothetical protein